ncbi:MAG: DUF3575 domain-containing protein [Bacteroidales bacterium]|nr:DUF3575 domain-containing protein [Bacteroidales bacterium]
MKKLFSLSVFFLCVVQAFPQENVVKVNTLSLLISTFSSFYERKLTDLHSAQIGFYFTTYSSYLTGSQDSRYTGFGLTPEFRYYFNKVFEDYYVAPFIRYQNWSVRDVYIQDDPSTPQVDEKTFEARVILQMFGGGILIGKEYIINERIVADFFIGPAYYTSSQKVINSGSSDYEYNGIVFDGFSIRFGTCIGFAF